MPAARIHKWIKEAEECLLQLQDQDKESLAAFRLIQQSQGRFFPAFELKVKELKEGDSSKSAYRPSWTDRRTGQREGTDVLLDFRFDLLAKVIDILKAAVTKLEIAGHYSLPTLGEHLRAARAHAGHSQREAAEKIGGTCQHKYISEWETGKRTPHVDMAKSIRDYIEKAYKP